MVKLINHAQLLLIHVKSTERENSKVQKIPVSLTLSRSLFISLFVLNVNHVSFTYIADVKTVVCRSIAGKHFPVFILNEQKLTELLKISHAYLASHWRQ